MDKIKSNPIHSIIHNEEEKTNATSFSCRPSRDNSWWHYIWNWRFVLTLWVKDTKAKCDSKAMTSLCKWISHTNCHMNDHSNLMVRRSQYASPEIHLSALLLRSLRWASAPTLFGYTAKQMASQRKGFPCLRIRWENDESARMWPAFKNTPACQCPCHPDQPSTWRTSMMCHLSLTSLWVMD